MTDLGVWLDKLRWPLTLLLATIVVGAIAFNMGRQPAPPLAVVAAPTASREIKVYVSGAVRQPGVYAVTDGDRVEDAVQAAGGATAEADLERLNLASRLHDGMHVQVPLTVVVVQGGLASGSTGSADLININTASEALLDTLPGVGPVTAKRIIDFRESQGPFQRIEELLERKIVNASTFENIKVRITAP